MKEENIIIEPFVFEDGIAWEQIYDTLTKKPAFISITRGEVTVQDFVQTVSGKVLPMVGEELEKGLIQLPFGVKEYGSVADLYKEIRAHIHKYLDVSELFEQLASFYVIMTWIYDRMWYVPYLRTLGDTGTGKNRFLDTIGGLCYRPMIVNSSITLSPVFHLLERWKGTLILDEADFKGSDETLEIVKILNGGMQANTPVVRMEKNGDSFKIKTYRVFGPKILATRQRFKDMALEARCLTETMNETTRKDIPDQLGKDFRMEQDLLRRKLLYYRLTNLNKIDPESLQCIDLTFLEPRLRQVGRSLLAVATDDAGKEVVKKFLLHYNKTLIEERSITTEGQIINFIHDCEEEFITPAKIAEGVDPDKKWLKSYKVGKILKILGLKTVLGRVNGKVIRYLLKDSDKLSVLYKRYVSDVSNTVTSVTAGEDAPQNPLHPQVSAFLHPVTGNEASYTTVTNVTSLQIEKTKELDYNSVISHIREKYPAIPVTTSDDKVLEWAINKGEVKEISPGKFEII